MSRPFHYQSIEGVQDQASLEIYLDEIFTALREKNSNIAILMMATDCFELAPLAPWINAVVDECRAKNVTTVVILNDDTLTQQYEPIRADRIVHINFTLWRCYNEIVVKGNSQQNLEWNHLSDKFLFLTGKPDRANRIRLLWKLEQANLLSHCVWSFFAHPELINIYNQFIPELAPATLQQKISQWQTTPDKAKVQSIGETFHYCGVPYNVDIFKDTKFRLISESRCESGTFNISEKTYITMLNSQPWIMAGQPGAAEYLGQQGYANFCEFVAYPYDDIMHTESRLDAVVNNSQSWLTDMPNITLIKQAVKHNRNHALAKAKQAEAVLQNVVRDLDLAATPDQIAVTTDK